MATRAADILGGCATANAARSNASLGLLPHETLQRILALVGSQQALARASRVDHLFCALVRQLGDDAMREDITVLRIMYVRSVVIVRGHGADNGRQHRHGMCVVAEALEEVEHAEVRSYVENQIEKHFSA